MLSDALDRLNDFIYLLHIAKNQMQHHKGLVQLTSSGVELQSDMKLEVKPMKKIKLAGDAAQSLIDEMFAKIN